MSYFYGKGKQGFLILLFLFIFNLFFTIIAEKSRLKNHIQMNYIIVLQIEEFGYIYTSELDSDTIFEQLNDIFFKYHTYDVFKMDQVKNVKLVA
jgi:hypothetical protein